MKNKQIHIETYGCQMNDYESDRTYRLFHDRHGYRWTDQPEDADLILYNTCSIREKADQKAYSSLGRLQPLKETRPDVVIAVGGCMAQSQGADIQKRFPYVDLVFGTHQWQNLPALVQKVEADRDRALEIDLYGWKNYSFLPYRESQEKHPVSEVVTVQNGCNKFCSFCLVPFTRGREISRPASDIMNEIKSLVEQGVRDVTLLGQNVNAYGEDRSGEISFAKLLETIGKVRGLERLRFVTSHPREFSFELIDSIAENSKICHHLHLPVQSGSDTILSRMRRGYTASEYRKKASYLLKKIPHLALTTDIIVGFPSETDEDFQMTMDLVEELEFDNSFSFSFSPRPHTKAALWSNEFIPRKISSERLTRLQSSQRAIFEKKSREYLGKVVDVLVEGEAKNGDGLLTGKTDTNRTINFAGPKELVGTMIGVKVTEALLNTLRGEIPNVPGEMHVG